MSFFSFKRGLWRQGLIKDMVSELEPVQVLMGIYLLSSPSSNMVCIYELNLSRLAKDLNVSPNAAREALDALIGAGFVEYDEEECFVWVREAFRVNVNFSNKNQVKGIFDLLDSLESTQGAPFVNEARELVSAEISLHEE